MQVGDDLMELGARCHHDGCNRQDYLPFHCDACAKPFCCEHRSYEAHGCEEGKKKSIVVPRCPDCDQLLSLELPREAQVDTRPKTLVQNRLFSLGHGALDWGRADDPDFMKSKFTAADVEAAIEKHRSAGCAGRAQAKGGPAGRKLKRRCRFGACKKREYILTECSGCHTKFCTGHRHASDHSCGNTALLRPKKTKRAKAIASSAPPLPIVASEPEARTNIAADPSGQTSMDADLARLCEMGFTLGEARRALAGSANRLEDAVRRLVAVQSR